LIRASSLWPVWVVGLRSPQFLLLIVIFGVITTLVYLNATLSLDYSINASLDRVNLSGNILYVLVLFASFGEIIHLIFASIILTIIRRTRKTGMILMITIVVITIIITYLKPIIAHTKPLQSVKLSSLPKGFNLESDSMTPSARDFSYPSNHVACITAFSYLIGYSLSRGLRNAKHLIWLLPFSVGLSQLILRQYYFSDMIGGFLFGLIFAILMSNILHIEMPFSRDRFKIN
jgi:undecaprenyl-diphosphatase